MEFNDDFIQYMKNKKILAIGCGSGSNDLRFGNKQSLGIECDEGKIKEGRQKGLNIQFGYAGRTKPAGKFDAVTLFHVLEHLETRKEVLDTLNQSHDALKKGGYLLIAVPYAYDSNAWLDWQHERCFTHHSLSSLVELSGFKIKDHYSFWHIPFENSTLKHEVGNYRCPFKRDYFLKLLSNLNLIRDIHLIAIKDKK